MKITIFWAVCLSMGAISACSNEPTISLYELVEIAVDASKCSEGDTCVLAGESECNCPFAVNETEVQRVEDAAKKVSCSRPSTEKCRTSAACEVTGIPMPGVDGGSTVWECVGGWD